MEESMVVTVAKFSKYPSGRDENDGTFNGEKFRREILLPAVKRAISDHKKLIISLKGVMSFGSSFLEESFGGLVRKEGINKNMLLNTITIETDKPSLDRHSKAIIKYINEA